MVARQILVLQVGVRVPVRQQNVLRVGIFYNTWPSLKTIWGLTHLFGLVAQW